VDLFKIQNTFSFNKDKLTIGFEYDYVTRTSQNQGILQETGFVNQNNINQAGCWSLGLLQMDFFYREKPWYAGQFVRKIIPKIELEKSSILFFTVLLNKQKKDLLSGLVRDVDKTFLNAKVQLPINDGEINFSFMEKFIAELEAYLIATNLKDYALTKEEQKVLDDFEKGKIVFGEFRIEDVLQWQSQKEIDPLKLENLKDKTEPLHPFYGQATVNNGIISYNQLMKEVLNNQNGKSTILIHSNNQNIIYLETPFYLKDGHGATSVLQCEELNKINQMFIISSIDKVIKCKYSYNNKATKIELKNTVIELPIKNNEPTYKIMETFISAIQKCVIKDVVLYADEKINTSKEVVNDK